MPTFVACAAGQGDHGRFLASAVAISAREGLLQNYESTIFARTAGCNLTKIKPARDYRSQEVASKPGWRILEKTPSSARQTSAISYIFNSNSVLLGKNHGLLM